VESVTAQSVYLVDPRDVRPGLAPIARCGYEAIADCFSQQRGSAHARVDAPDCADIVLAPIQGGGYGHALEPLRGTEFFRKYRRKLVVYSADDDQFPSLPGLYPSLPASWRPRGWALGAHYLSSHIHRFPFARPGSRTKDLAFSFCGSSRTHPVRERILRLPARRDAVLFDSSSRNEPVWWHKSDHQELIQQYQDVLERSRFFICPRGVSHSSIRLFECMESGSVPVIVSDDLALPVGPDWDRCSLRVAERDVDSIPDVVARAEPDAARMAAAARAYWEDYFAPDRTANSLVAWARQLLRDRANRAFRGDAVRVRIREATSWSLRRKRLRSVWESVRGRA
jgi:hypothetical protein